AVDNRGNVVVTGASVNVSGNSDYYTAKYAAADGALLWEHRYDGPGKDVDYAYAVAVDANGNAVVTGVSLAVYNGSGEFYTVKYAAANGALLWEKRGPVGDPRALALDHGGNVVVTGSSAGNGHGEYYTAKYAAADGALLWERRYHGPAP